jgi:hypothetical protein
MLVPYAPTGDQPGCCKNPPPKDTPHHLVEVHCFTVKGGRKAKKRVQGFEDYNDRRAPCVCVWGSRYTQEHGKMHAIQNSYEESLMDPNGERSQMGGLNNQWNYGAAKKGAIHAHRTTFPDAGPNGEPCSEECLEKQLDSYHKQVGVKDNKTPLRADDSPLKEEQREYGEEQLGDLE